MSNIEQNLQKILSSKYGKDVRQSIHDGIHDCYEDGKAGSTDLIAREQIANLVSMNNPTEGNSELQDIRVGFDGTTYESAGEAVRKQVGNIRMDLGNYYHESTDLSRAREIGLVAKTGDVVYIKPLYWDGQIPCRFTLSGYDGNIWHNFDMYTTVIGKGYTVIIDADYEKYRMALVNIDPIVTPATLKILCVNLSDDKIAGKLINNELKLNSFDIEKLPITTKLSQTAQSRAFSFDVSLKQGEVINLRVSNYTGNVTPKGINIYFSTDGVTYITRETINSIGCYKKIVVQEDAIGLRVGTVLESVPSNPVTIEVEIIKDPIEQIKPLEGKYLSILGASISTFDSFIPEGYSAYYPHDTTDVAPVLSYHDTYWGKLMDATGMKLCVNNSSAGSYCTTGHGNDAMSGCGDRCTSLHTDEHEPDVIIIQLGGNDFNYNTDIGNYDGTQIFPTDTTSFREAYAIMLKNMITRYPVAKIYCGTIPPEDRSVPFGEYPEKNESNVSIEIFNNAIREIANVFGCEVIEFAKSGLSIANKKYMYQDHDSASGYAQHPNRLGHSLLANVCIKQIVPSCGITFSHTII